MFEGNVVIFTQLFELNTKPTAQEVQAVGLPDTQEIQGDWHCTHILVSEFKNRPGKHERQTLGVAAEQLMQKLPAAQGVQTLELK